MVPSQLYHLTLASRLPSIKKEGLSPKRASRWIYLAADDLHASGYEAFYPGKEVALLEIDLSKLDEGLLGPDDVDLADLLAQEGEDEGEWKNFTWLESLKLSGQATYDGIIPPSAIRVMKTWKVPSY